MQLLDKVLDREEILISARDHKREQLQNVKTQKQQGTTRDRKGLQETTSDNTYDMSNTTRDHWRDELSYEIFADDWFQSQVGSVISQYYFLARMALRRVLMMCHDNGHTAQSPARCYKADATRERNAPPRSISNQNYNFAGLSLYYLGTYLVHYFCLWLSFHNA